MIDDAREGAAARAGLTYARRVRRAQASPEPASPEPASPEPASPEPAEPAPAEPAPAEPAPAVLEPSLEGRAAGDTPDPRAFAQTLDDRAAVERGAHGAHAATLDPRGAAHAATLDGRGAGDAADPAAHAATLDARWLADALATTLAPLADDPATADTLAPAVSGARTVHASSPSAEQPGRYRRGRELGRGGMGRVVLAVDDQLGREVAIKEIRTGSGGASVGEVIRFVREARVTGQLEHPGIVPVHELARSADGTFSYTMKRLRGQSLAAALRAARTGEDRVALLRHFRDVCEAVAYAHSRGVVHRDLKPDNIMVGGFGETLVVDWGIAKVRDLPDVPAPTRPTTEAAADDDARPIDEGALIDAPMTEAGHAIGTPAYMSPEQARGDLEAIDERSDVWGLGAVLFEILTGRPPFVGSTALAILSAVLVDPPPGVLTIAPDAPPELAAIADRALRRDRAERYASAKEIADEIGAWQDGRQVRAYRYGAWDLVQRFVRRHRAASIAAGSIGLAVVGAALFMTWSYRAELAMRRDAETRALIAEAGRLDQLGHRPQAFALLRAASSIGGADIEPALARAGLLAHADEPQPIVLAGHTSLVADLIFTAGGAHVVTCSQDRTLREWDVATGRLLRTITHDRRMHAIVASDDGTRWLTPSDADDTAHVAFTLWDAESGRALRDLGTGLYAESLAITRDGQRAASAGRDGTVRIWDLGSGEGRVVAQHGGWVRALSFSPDGTALVIGGRGPRVQIVTEGGERALDGIEGEVRALDWSDTEQPGSARLAVGLADGSLLLFRAADGSRERIVAAHRGPLVDVEFSRDGARIATASEDGSARIWSAASGALVLDLPHRGRVSAAHFDRTGRRVATTALDQREALVWSLPAETGLVLRGHAGWVHDAVFAPDGARIASASRDGTVRLWSSATGLEERVLTGHEGSVYCVRFSSDGARVASGGRDGTVRLWDAATGRARLAVAAHGDAVYDLVFLEGERIASVSVDGSVRVSSTRDGAELWAHRGTLPLNALASHAGELAVGDTTGGIELWSVGASAPSRRLAGHSAAIRALDFSDDGALLVSGSLDGRVILWEAATGRSIRELAESERGITAVDLAPDGARVVTASEDGLVRVWDALTGHLGTTLDGESPNVRAASFSPAGDRIVSGGADQTVRIWRSVRADTGAILAASASETNLRACQDDVTVVPVVLGPGVDPIWAPESLCTDVP